MSFHPQPTHTGTCHCGAVQFEVDLPDGLVNPGRCNCSMCGRRGAIMAYVPLDALRITRGEGMLTPYQFNTKTARHWFCSRCGIYTHHRCRSDPSLYAFNVACLDGADLFAIGEVEEFDGVNHPSDG